MTHQVRGLLGVALVTAVSALGLAACGGGTPEACGLLTDDEATRILDTPTRPGERDDDDENSNSAWISTDSTLDPEAAVYGVHLWVRDDDDARVEFARRRDRVPRTFDEFVIVPVAGLGDEAYRVEYTEPNDTGTPSLPNLYVRVGDRVLGVGTFDSDERPVTIAQARRIQGAAARAALARL